MINYSNIKIVFYALGLILTFFSIWKYGLIDSHTPPTGFILPLFVMLIGLLWMIIDWVIFYFSKNVKINFYINYIGVVLNFIIVAAILLDALQ